jgi:uncharacterized repeat protein (TIGR03803 family)
MNGDFICDLRDVDVSSPSAIKRTLTTSLTSQRLSCSIVAYLSACMLDACAGHAIASPTTKLELLVSFGNVEGATPYASLIEDGAGNLYGTTEEGGVNGDGVVYELSPPSGNRTGWNRAVLHSFAGKDGMFPFSSLMRDGAGNLYGTTCEGGQGNGVVYELSPPPAGATVWKEKVLYAFADGEGRCPFAGVIEDPAGNLFGSTQGGGPQDAGSVYELIPPASGESAWTEIALHYFNGADGRVPQGGVILDGMGNLYGATTQGGDSNAGVVYELSPPGTGKTTWTETTLHAFDIADGQAPFAPLIADNIGNLYGTTGQGGVNDGGVVFELRPPGLGESVWKESVLNAFEADFGAYKGYRPESGVIADGAGNLFGMTVWGGKNGDGLVFRLNSPHQGKKHWTETVIHAFNGAHGRFPSANLIADGAGNLYGVTVNGGKHDSGTAFKLSP